MMAISKRVTAGVLLAAVLTSGGLPAAEEAENELPADARRVLADYFDEKDGYREGDLITRSDVEQILKAFEEAGVVTARADAVREAAVADESPLARYLSSRNGQRFMRRITDDPQAFDRLDRVSREPGGDRLLRDLVSLPDGYRYARANRPRAVPGLEELLPKDRSGKTRRVPDYDEPTGRIYTRQHLERMLATPPERETSDR